MSNIDTITNLKKALDLVYEDFNKRIDKNEWENAIMPAYKVDAIETSIIVIDFLQSHIYIPSSCIRAMCEVLKLKEKPSLMVNIFNENILEGIIERSINKNPIGYEHMPDNLSEDEIHQIIVLAKNVREYISNSQIYMAEQTFNELKSLCPNHPDVLDIENDISAIPSEIVKNLIKIVEKLNNKKYYFTEQVIEKEKAEEIIKNSGLKDAIHYYESLIAEDPDKIFAHYELGKLYLEKGELSRVAHISELLFDRYHNKTESYLLKAMLLEKSGFYEDALFYYNLAYKNNPYFEDAIIFITNLLKRMDGKSIEDFIDNDCIIEEKKHVVNVDSLIKNIAEIKDTLNEIENMLEKGRFSQAYYEIMRVDSEYNDSEILKFLKAFILYMLNKEKEARDAFKELSYSKIFGNYTIGMIADIDKKNVDKGIVKALSPEDGAAIYFNMGMYNEAFNALINIPMGEMSKEALVIRGRCEIYSGRLDSAYDSLEKALKKDGYVDNIQELMGMICQAKGELEKALDHYNRSISDEKRADEAYRLKAELLFKMERNDELISFHQSLLNNKRIASDVDGFAGMVYLKESFYDEKKGVTYLQRGIASKSTYIEFYLTLIKFYIENKMYYAALECIEDGLSNSSISSELFMKKAEVLFVLRKYRAVELITGMLLTERPNSPELQYIRGMIFAEKHQNKEAIKWLQNAFDLSSDTHKYAYELADKCFEIGDMYNALNYYTKALELDHNDSISLKRRAIIYKDIDKKEEAISDIKRAMELIPDDPEVYIIIGDILTKYLAAHNMADQGTNVKNNEDDNITSDFNQVDFTKNIEESTSDIWKNFNNEPEYYFSKALKINPEYRQGYLTRARYYAEKGKTEEALADIDRVMDMNKDEPDAYMVRGIIYQLADRNREAVSDFKRAAEAEFMLPQVYSYISKCFNSLQSYEEALEAAEEGLKSDKNFINLYLNRGVAKLQLKRYEEAVEDFKFVIAKRNEASTSTVEGAYRFRGLAYEKMERLEDALHDYRILLRYNTNNMDIRKRMNDIESIIQEKNKRYKFKWFNWRKKH